MSTINLPPIDTDLDDSDDEIEYEEIDEEALDDVEDFDLEMDFSTTLKSVKDVLDKPDSPALHDLIPRAEIKAHPEVMDDFIRNYLELNGFSTTLDEFQNEWYEKETKGDLIDIPVVPDVYLQNVKLQQSVKELQKLLKLVKTKAEKVKGTFSKLKKERDFHKMHHQRVVHEKRTLIQEIKRLKKHCDKYQPVLVQLKKKYEAATKKKHLLKMRADTLTSQLKTMQIQFDQKTEGKETKKSGRGTKEVIPDAEDSRPKKRVRKPKATLSGFVTGRDTMDAKMRTTGYQFPSDRSMVNPYLSPTLPALTCPKVNQFSLGSTLEGHTMSISALSLHPTRPQIVSASDDTTWKMWSIPKAKLMMTGEGHKDWVSGCEFHPLGTLLVTCGGDTNIKIWDINKHSCSHTLNGHTQPVWDCVFHCTGHFFASCSMDHTVKIWDMKMMREKVTLRGHKDSVNSVRFRPYSNDIVTCSGDRTISLWDPRTIKCVETFFEHDTAVNDVQFQVRGDSFASCDADGVVKLWDMRKLAIRDSFKVSNYPANCITFDYSGGILGVGTDDANIVCINLNKRKNKPYNLSGHKDAVLSLKFSKDGKMLFSSGADSVVRIWH